jgi:hypothetical protein
MMPSDATSSTGYALVYVNREYLVYQPASSSFSVTLPANSFSFEWIDPATGSVSQTGIYNAGAGSNTFNLPAGLTNDALLHLTSSTSSSTPFNGAIVSFTLINADSDQDIGPLSDGTTLNLATLPTHDLNVRANTSPATVGSVVFMLTGAQTNDRTESGAPYSLFGDVSGNYNAWTPPVGSYTLHATPFSGSGGTGIAGTALTINFTVVNPTPTPTP